VFDTWTPNDPRKFVIRVHYVLVYETTSVYLNWRGCIASFYYSCKSQDADLGKRWAPDLLVSAEQKFVPNS